MSLRRIGDVDMFPVGLGAMPLSRPSMVDERQRAIGTLHAALDSGVTLIDTANVYAPSGDEVGHNEAIVREGLRTWDGTEHARGRILVATKGGITRHGDQWGRDGSPEGLMRAARASARQLGVETIDLYYIHRLDPAVLLDDQIRALAAVKESGLAERIGLSNVTLGQLDRALELIGGPGDGGIVAVQNEFSVRYRENADVIDRCQGEGIAFVAWSPLGGASCAHEPDSPYQSFNSVARERGVSIQQLTLAWLLALSPAIIPIVGSTRPATIEASVHAADVDLTEDEVAQLNATAVENISVFPDSTPPPPM